MKNNKEKNIAKKKERIEPPPVPVHGDNNNEKKTYDIAAVKYEMPPVPVSTSDNIKGEHFIGQKRSENNNGSHAETENFHEEAKKEPMLKREIELNEYIMELNGKGQTSKEKVKQNGYKATDAKKRKIRPVSTKKKPKKKHPFIRFIFTTVIFLVIVCFLAGAGLFMYLLDGVPELDISKKDYYSMASIIYDANNEKLAEFPGTKNVNWASANEIPEMLKNAFIAIEDKRFYSHPGVDIKRTLSAIYGQLTHTSEHGGSTITQQLIKNTHLTAEKTYKRKAQEIFLAVQMEKKLSKDEILEWYMNDIFLGENNYGVKNAAKDYFNKDLSELTIRECAMLAGLAQSPSIYDPRINYYSNKKNITDKRTDTVLYTMHNLGYIDDIEYQNALNEEVKIQQYPERFELYDYPTYVEYVVDDAAQLLLMREGKSEDSLTSEEMSNMIRNGGYRIYTAFDETIQNQVQETVAEYTNYPRSKSEKQAEVSAVIIDHHTGRVLAMISGREETTTADSFNRATDSLQAVGSSMKPLSVYAPALDTGCFPGTTVEDMPKKIQGYDTEKGYPGGDTTNAMITMRRALELSHNIPAVRFMLEKVGIDKCHDYLVDNGFKDSELSMTPAGMALGADGVTTLEMTAAYATLANGGTYIRPHAVVRIEDRYGNVLVEESGMDRRRVFKETTSWLITDILETNMVEGLGVNARLKDMHCAGKTGTHVHKVISFGGYTPYYTSFVRISTDDYADFYNASSYTMSAGLWKAYMQKIHEGLTDRAIQDKTAEALEIKKYYTCTNSGLLANNWCAGSWEYAAPDSAPTEYCSGHNYGVAKEETYVDTSPQINYDDPEWYLHGWWGEDGVFHPE